MDSYGITAVPGIRVGHYTDRSHATGCTVVLCEKGAVGGVDVRGSAPGTRETDLLDPTALAPRAHAVLLTGGSTYGLSAATGVMESLEEWGVGTEFGGETIPIVPSAVIFDLGLITGHTRPGAREGRSACEVATDGPVDEGSLSAKDQVTSEFIGVEDLAVVGGKFLNQALRILGVQSCHS